MDLKSAITIANGTFTTLDEVAPTIDITTHDVVSSTFNVEGTIHDVGGMGTASVTLTGVESGKTQTLNPELKDPVANNWTFSEEVEWTEFEVVRIEATATDAAGNPAMETKMIEVSPVGFSKEEPIGYLNAQPTVIKVFTTQMDESTVTLTLTGPETIPLGVEFDKGYAQNTSVPPLADGTWTVTARGNDTISGAAIQPYSWSFTLDTVPPVINSFSITDTDGDGFLEADERLDFTWDVTGADAVHLMDNKTKEVFFVSTELTGTNHTTVDVGNRDMVFAAFDRAGNAAYVPFHLYYNYMAWVNTTRVGTVSGIDTNLSAVRQLDLTAQGKIEFFNAREVPSVPIGEVKRTTTAIGQVTDDTYVTVDNTANATYTGADTYDCVWTYNPCSDLDFLAQAPHIDAANLVILEANESYLAQIAHEGKSARDTVDYNNLVKKCAWIFFDGGYTQIEVNSDGTFTQHVAEGKPLSGSTTGIIDTLCHPDNQVNLTAGYRLSAQAYENGTALPAIELPAGDYALAAICVDGDRLGAITAMPFTVMDRGYVGEVPASVTRGTPITAAFETECDRIGAVVIRHDTWNADVRVDASTINRDSLSVNLTYNDVPATQQLYRNIYTSPNAAAYANATRASSVSIPTDALLPGTYDVHMVAAYENTGTVKCYGYHQVEVQSPCAPVADFTADPTSGKAPLTVTFTDKSTGDITEWYWQFGDGKTCGNQNPVPHVYNESGTYQVNLTVTGPGGSDTKSTVITVTDEAAPVAMFTATPTKGYAPLEVKFVDKSTGDIASWFWDFGDGTNSTAQNVTHKFKSSGKYTVNLTVEGPGGSASNTTTIDVRKWSPSGGGGGGGSSPTVTPEPTEPSAPGADLWSVFFLSGATFTTTDGVQSFSIDLDEADHVKVEGNTITFKKNGLTYIITASDLKESGDTITGTVKSLMIKADTLEMEVEDIGDISARFTAEFPFFPVNATLGATLVENVSKNVVSAYSVALLGEGLDVSDVAYTLKVTKRGIEKCGPATITMTVSPEWVNARGGVDKIRILRQADDGTTQVLETAFKGYDEDGQYVFEALSPDGLCEIGLVAVTASTAVTVQPTDVGGDVETPTTIPAGGEETPTEGGLPVGLIAVVLVAIVAIAAVGYYLQKKE